MLLFNRGTWVPILVASGISALLLGGKVLQERTGAADASAQPRTALLREAPSWAGEVDSSAVAGWIKIKGRFHLTEETVRKAIHIFSKNSRYSSDQSLHDLTRNPGQVERAFALIASTPTGRTVDLGVLKDELRNLVIAAAPFPDQYVGERRPQLSEDPYSNLMVFSSIELLHDLQHDHRVKEILKELRLQPAQ